MLIAPAEMRVITREMYLMGRERRFPEALTPELEANLVLLLEPVNLFVASATAEGVPIGVDERTGTIVASGWRPLAVNDRTQNAGADSTHIWCLGIDLQDLTPERLLARFALRCARQGGLLEQWGLYMERPQWTPDWVHLQLRSPKSGRRVYIPSSRPPLVAALPEEVEFVV